MVNYFIYAKDYSMSTENVPYYHENGLKTLRQFKSDVNKINSELTECEESRIIYLHWGATCEEVNEKTAIDTYIEHRGDSWNTLPETIIEWIKEHVDADNKIKLLYIITDGLIGNDSCNKCLELNETMHYETVVFHGFHEDLRCIDLSVASSFLKAHCIIHRNNEQLDDVDISEEFDYDTITIDNFDTEKDKLKSYIKLKYLNSSKQNVTALSEIDKLKKLRKRLLNKLTSQKNTNLDTRDKNTFVREFKNTVWYKNLSNPTYDLNIDIDKAVSTLINYIINEKKSYDFDVLKYETQFADEVPEEEIADIDFTTDQEIEFPDIILDDEKGVPVILCTEFNLLDKMIFNTSNATASFSKFKSTMECPLFLLNDTDLNESIGYFYTLNVYKQLLEQTTKTEPRTRRPFHGGLVLTDTDDFDRYNDYILSATYFNFKKVYYNGGLFYFVLWKICEKKQWMDKNVLEQFKKYMLRRVSTTVCRIGLSSLPLDPKVNSSLPTALWYCVEISSCIFKDDLEHFAYERLRMYYGVAHSMIEILKYLQYDLDMKAINKRRDLIRHVMILKKMTSQKDKVFYILENVFKNVNGFLVCEIEKPGNIKKLNYLKLNHKEMLSDDISKEKVNFNEYVHVLNHIDDSDIQMCDKTYRPFFMIDPHTSYYSEIYKNARNVVFSNVEGKTVVKYGAIDKLDLSRILSYYKFFQQCVKGSNKFPTVEEYAEYILKKNKFREDLVTIFPVNVYKKIEQVFLSYESLIKDVSVSEFIRVSDMYVNRLQRIKAENRREFESDDEINEFISMEESKNKLVKLSSEQHLINSAVVPVPPRPLKETVLEKLHRPSRRTVLPSKQDAPGTKPATEAPPIVDADDDGFTLVQRKNRYRPSRNNVRGTPRAAPKKISAASLTTCVYISRLDKMTTASDIILHLSTRCRGRENRPLPASVQELQTKSSDFKAFKIHVFPAHLKCFLAPGLWPKGVQFRRLREARIKNNNEPISSEESKHEIVTTMQNPLNSPVNSTTPQPAMETILHTGPSPDAQPAASAAVVPARAPLILDDDDFDFTIVQRKNRSHRTAWHRRKEIGPSKSYRGAVLRFDN